MYLDMVTESRVFHNKYKYIHKNHIVTSHLRPGIQRFRIPKNRERV